MIAIILAILILTIPVTSVAIESSVGNSELDQYEESSSDLNGSAEIYERLGWLKGINEFNVLRKQLKRDIWYNFTPNVTWAEVIEETLGWVEYEFDVEEFLDDLEVVLMEKFENYQLIISVLPTVIEDINIMLNSRITWASNQWVEVKLNLRDFMRSFFDRDLRPIRSLIRFLRSTFRLVLGVSAMILYTNATERQEWVADLLQSTINFINAWKVFIHWLTKEPWLEPVHIHGCITGLDPDKLDNVTISCKSGEVYTNEDGFFEGLEFITKDEINPWGVHECVVTAITADGDEKKIDGLIQTGALSDGLLNLTIDFQAEDDNTSLQLHNKALFIPELKHPNSYLFYGKLSDFTIQLLNKYGMLFSTEQSKLPLFN